MIKHNHLFRFLLICFLFLSISSISQTNFEVPENVELKTRDDYTKYEATVVEAAKWLEETDLDKELEKRKDVNSFVIQWATGSPTVSIELNAYLSKIYGKNEQLLAIYIARYTSYTIENRDSARNSAIKAALNSMMKVYRKNISITKSKEMEKILKLSDSELDTYISEKSK